MTLKQKEAQTPRTNHAEENSGRGHPLFDPPRSEREDKRDISYIHVFRGGVCWPTQFSAEEIQTLDDIYQRWGGGTYVLKGRPARNHTIVASQTVSVAGKPKPFSPDEPAPKDAPPQTAPHHTTSTVGEVIQFLATTGIPLAIAYLKESAEDRRAREAREAEERRRSDERFLTMMTNSQQATQQSTAQMMQTFVQMSTTANNNQGVSSESLVNMFKGGGEYALQLAKSTTPVEGASDKSMEALIGGAQALFISQAEQAGAEKARAELARAQIEMHSRGGYGPPPMGYHPPPYPMPPPMVPGIAPPQPMHQPPPGSPPGAPGPVVS